MWWLINCNKEIFYSWWVVNVIFFINKFISAITSVLHRKKGVRNSQTLVSDASNPSKPSVWIIWVCGFKWGALIGQILCLLVRLLLDVLLNGRPAFLLSASRISADSRRPVVTRGPTRVQRLIAYTVKSTSWRWLQWKLALDSEMPRSWFLV